MGQIKNWILVVALAVSGLVASPAVAQTGQTLNNDSLKAMLDGLGYEPKALSKGFLIDIKQDTWDIYMQLVLSGDGTKLGMNSNLGLINDLSAVPASKWLDLLVANGNIDPSTFYVDQDQKKLYLHRVLDNHEITPAFLRGQVESFANNLKSTEGIWNFTK
ncbi:MAG TPA: hypothetical protein VG942_07610 [Hyphomonadaceae bacterium]|nr:hypothetical protein [Hyphomonadaceae bacterium]